MTDVASLELRVLSSQVQTAQQRLDRLERSGKKTERATDGMSKAFMRMVAPLTAAVSAVTALNKLVDVSRQFDKLNAGLITATGSSENAKEAFSALVDFAAQTPYDLNQAVDGFTKLVNMGLTPSEAALKSYGNTAAAMGKDLNMMIEAVADAATGEFERLKEFGIKASSEGDRVSFTFQGVTTNIGKNAAEIEKYLMDLGENQFAGAMENRVNSLDGAISNLGDTWDNTFRTISERGAGDLMESQIRMATSALEEFNDYLGSGQMEAQLQAILGKFDGWAKDIDQTMAILSSMFTDETGYWTRLIDENVDTMISAFRDFPENVRAFIQLMTVEVMSGFDKVTAYAGAFKDGIKAIFTGDTFEGVADRLNQELSGINAARDGSIEQILAERETALASYQAQMDASVALRAAYDEEKKAREANTADRLAKYKVGGAGGKGDEGESPVDKAALAAQKKRKQDFENLVEDLLTEEEAIAISYSRRKAIIEANTQAESAARENLMARLDEAHAKELDRLNDVDGAYNKRMRLAQKVAEIEEAGWNDAQRAAAEYQAQMETLWQALNEGLISQARHEEAVGRVTAAYEKQVASMDDTFFNMEEFGKEAARNVQTAFADFLFDPFDKGLDGMLLGFVKVIQRMAAEAAAAQLAGALFGSSGGGSGGGILGAAASAIGGFFGASGRAAGGPTSARTPYEVAERGPEVYEENGRTYLLSSTAGNVKPLGASEGTPSDGGRGVVVNLSVVVNNSGTEVQSGSGSSSSATANEFALLMKQVSIRTIQDESRPGGILWRLQQGS